MPDPEETITVTVTTFDVQEVYPDLTDEEAGDFIELNRDGILYILNQTVRSAIEGCDPYVAD